MKEERGANAERRCSARRRRVAAWAAFAVAGSGLGACTSITPPAPSALPIPQAWSMSASDFRSATATPLAAWWARFDDPLMVALIDDALRMNTSVRSAMAALAQSRALAVVQRASLMPALSGSGSAQRSRLGDTGTFNTFKAGFDASWEPDVFGGVHAAVAAADADAQASAASLGEVRVSIAAEVAVNYLQLRGLQARLAIATANLNSQEETLQITQWRTQAGLLTSVEVEQALTATAQTRAQIPLLQALAAQTEHSLAVLTWRPPASLHDRLAPAAVATMAKPPDDLVLAFPADTLRQRPDVRAAEARVTAASQRVTQADAARLPTLQLGGSLGLSALTLPTLTRGSSVVTSLLAGASAPLFDGGAARAQVRAQQAALQQAGAAYDAAVFAALKDVEDSLAALAGDRDRLQSLRIAADAAQNAALLARQRYASGLIDFQVVLETQRAALITQDGVASTAADLNADLVRLYKALGGGWENADAGRTAGADASSGGQSIP